MASAVGISSDHAFRSSLAVLAQEDDGQPISLSAVWLVPGVLVGAVVVLVLLTVRGK